MLSQIVYDFEAAHQRGETPRLQDYVPPDAPDRTAIAAELARIDVEYRRKRGLPVRLDDYLTPFPELAADKGLLRELLEAESRARHSRGGKTPEPDSQRLTASGAPPWTVTTPTARAAEATLSVMDLLDALRQNQLLGSGRLEELARGLATPPPEPRTLAGDLVRRGWLTAYQVEQLFQGRGPQLVLGPYLLLERLGEGGMGTVYKARHRSMERVVALKIIRPERLAQGDALQRFQREIRALAQLAHANIVTAYHADCAGDTSFLVMEYVEGTDLYRLVEASGPLAVPLACDFIRQAALGLQHACERGLVHRDVKPSNLLLAQDRAVIKLLDLGLARHETAGVSATVPGELTREGVMLGTPDYMAPEQAVDPRQADIRADIYSLGCTLYYLLVARPPFPEGTLTQKLLWHQHADPPPVEDLRPGLPAGLAAVIRKMMAKRAEDRYQTPAEAAAALAPFLTPQPEETAADLRKAATVSSARKAASPPPPPPKLAPGRRGRGVSARVVTGLALLLLLLGAAVYYFTRTESPKQFQARIRTLLRQGEIKEALNQIGASGQSEPVKAAARERVREAAVDWADQQLKTKQAPAKVVRELIERLMDHFPVDAQLAERRDKAFWLEIRLQRAFAYCP
jgi:serine/threonine protein kinase